MDYKMERVKALRAELTKASEDYYNGTESMSNYEYDAKFDELKLLEDALGIDENSFTDSVGAEVDTSNGLAKVTHEFEAKSLGKSKSVAEVKSEQSKTADGEDGETVLSWKCDGCTVQLTYEGGKLVLGATRGNGRVGQDITSNCSYIKGIPATISEKGKLVVRGEAMMAYSEFERLNTDGQFANPRNLASGTLTAQDPAILKERQLEFKAFELVYAKGTVPTEFAKQLDYLEKLGFGVVPHTVYKVKDIATGIADWSGSDKIKAFGFPVDGLVVAYNDTTKVKDLEGTGHHPSMTKSMAFKWADDTAPTILRKIEWSPSRTGLLNPVAIFDVVDLCGTQVRRASLHNVSYISSLNLKVGDRITVYKANMIIPQVAENEDRGKGKCSFVGVTCPCCNTEAVIENNNGTLTMKCPNSSCSAKRLGRYEHYICREGMNIFGLSEKTLALMLDNNIINNLYDLYTLDASKKKAYAAVEGLGEKGYDNLLNNIQASLTTDTEHFIYACGIEGIGTGQAKAFVQHVKRYWSELDDYHSGEPCEGKAIFECLVEMAANDYDFTQVKSIGEKLANSFKAFLTSDLYHNEYKKCFSYLKFIDAAPVIAPSGNKGVDFASGKVFVVTGKLESYPNREALVDVIESLGGHVSGSVSAKTDYLINNDITSTSSKNAKAKQLNIPIISEATFRQKAGLDD